MKKTSLRPPTGPLPSAATHMELVKAARVGDRVTFRRTGDNDTIHESTITEADSFDIRLADGTRLSRDFRKKTTITLLTAERA